MPALTHTLTRSSVLALVLAAVGMPDAALADPDKEARGGWRSSERAAPRAEPSGGRGWQAPSGGQQPSWSSPRQTQAPAPQAAPPPPPQQSQAAWGRAGGNAGNREERGNHENWQGRGNGDERGNRENWQARGNGDERGRGSAQAQNSYPARTEQAAARDRSQDRRDTNYWRGNDSGGSRRGDGDRDRDRWRDGRSERDGYRDSDRGGWRGSERYHGDRSRYSDSDHRWDRHWRDNHRYDWYSYRSRYPSTFRLGIYYAPYRHYHYRRLSIGFFLDALFFSDRYWIDDPWYYRLPPAYGPYRWVRYYDDALMVNIYTGEVVDVIYDFFW